mgnify:CR=1 FL=1
MSILPLPVTTMSTSSSSFYQRKADEAREEQIKKEKHEIAVQMAETQIAVQAGVWNAVYGAKEVAPPPNYQPTPDNQYNTPFDYFTKESK